MQPTWCWSTTRRSPCVARTCCPSAAGRRSRARTFHSRIASTWVNGVLAWDGQQLVGAPATASGWSSPDERCLRMPHAAAAGACAAGTAWPAPPSRQPRVADAAAARRGATRCRARPRAAGRAGDRQAPAGSDRRIRRPRGCVSPPYGTLRVRRRARCHRAGVGGDPPRRTAPTTEHAHRRGLRATGRSSASTACRRARSNPPPAIAERIAREQAAGRRRARARRRAHGLRAGLRLAGAGPHQRPLRQPARLQRHARARRIRAWTSPRPPARRSRHRRRAW